jgi:sugar phosphate permease
MPSAPFRKKIFYGWWIVLGGMGILAVSSGIGFFGHALILDPLRTEFGWPKGTISSAVTLFFLVAAVAGSVIGGKIDKYGTPSILVFGSLCIGSGFILLARIQALWQLYATYVLIAIGWSATSVIPISTLIANWFIEKRGFAMSVAMTGLSVGGIVVVPAASYFLNRWGFREVLPFFGFAFWAIIIPIGQFLLKKEPSVMGLLPDGTTPQTPDQEKSKSASVGSSQMRVWTCRQVMGTKAFWAIVLAFLLVLGSQLAFMIHEISFLSPFLGPAGAATAVSLMTGISFCGRLFVGSFVDRADKRAVAITCFLLQGGAVFTIVRSSDPLSLYLCVMAFGLAMGNIVMMQSLIIGECFGLVSFGKVSGLVMLFTSSGSAFGPMIAGTLFDLTQSYKTGFTLMAFSYILASLFFLFAKPPSFRKGGCSPRPHAGIEGNS